MSNPIQLCLERLHLGDDDKIKQRAEQFQGQLSNLPIKLFSKGGPNCKSVISIQLAYESLQHYDWNIQLAAQLAGCKASAYESVLSMVRKQLNIQPTITFDTLLVALGSTTMSEPVKELWTSFQQDYLSQFKGVQKSNAQQELELPCWKGGIIYCCSKALGVMYIFIYNKKCSPHK
ncbi:uncharacterized protein BX663DRAFT_432488 [Cokeromyces recurvatus]|uniref:uncharacterized protein n=1 Tax=Cokeromyces recurvatus TaxID=90255 RepID=UPI002220E066|nr:uncharacterized protein BX663DRAFT_432488 [Cokeromyces recurvatus]KAI7903855.1 hypothetical protein BX663DRAFT_432488 [Cokeromyces recurvatus]